jgi:hypothetical protein
LGCAPAVAGWLLPPARGRRLEACATRGLFGWCVESRVTSHE